MKQEDKNDGDCIRTLSSVLALSLIFVCGAGLVISLAWSSHKKVESDKLSGTITLNVKPDSCAGEPLINISADIVDSLNLKMQIREQVLAERYQHLLEQKERDEDIFSFGSIMVGIVISLCGFWGVKSFEEIKEKAKRIAEDVADSTAKSVAQQTAEIISKRETDDKLTAKKISEIIKERIIEELTYPIEQKLRERTQTEISELSDKVKQNEKDIFEMRREMDKLLAQISRFKEMQGQTDKKESPSSDITESTSETADAEQSGNMFDDK